ncbi:MAG: RluA family pseudouridine synthase [Candidatus Dormiibacterota bacterium]
MTEGHQRRLTVGAEEAGTRLDRFLAQRLGTPRALAQRSLQLGLVRVDGLAESRASLVLHPGAVVAVAPGSAPATPGPAPADPRVVYSDSELVVIDKPAGLAVHTAPSLKGPTLADWVASQPGPWSTMAGPERPGIVHRLDRGTSGLLVLARTDRAHADLSGQLRQRSMGREYWALAVGSIKEDRGRIEAAVGRERSHPQRMSVTARGRDATTEFWVLERLPRHVALRLRLLSGRTHQIRVHLAYIHRPLVGDPLYGRNEAGAARPALHAAMLHLRHPGSGEELSFVSPLPQDLRDLRERLGGEGEPAWPWAPTEEA